ncbi:hypothetical protein [Methylobacterium gnaphalii]|uniref:Uncharacterized protein n=1 Tax=Methylobacterium gnaphalii TaxID=1010610 RepID=A0A512JS76_9HYPH|nr:hypothetical protein [Methylobacterium gnaphalii]GEP12801.1 hypothetical protein MGN01_46460 [Methylobacterium gnaphalii]GJD71707.1 hypothetical protein MMMDOFMJ_4670 [Methylobacterium gnaphalii]
MASLLLGPEIAVECQTTLFRKVGLKNQTFLSDQADADSRLASGDKHVRHRAQQVTIVEEQDIADGLDRFAPRPVSGRDIAKILAAMG